MSDKNMRLYSAFREVPKEAKKTIKGGRLSGFTDINPMWRMKALTEQFGPCGFGWKYDIGRQWLESGSDGAVAAFVNVYLFVKENDEWSAGIPGTGGSAFVAKENKGLYTDDAAYKKALTDAIGVAAKALGVGADVYFEKDASKYQSNENQEEPKENPVVEERKSRMNKLITDKKMTAKAIKEQIYELQRKGLVSTTSTAKMTDDEFNIHMSLLYEYIGAA